MVRILIATALGLGLAGPALAAGPQDAQAFDALVRHYGEAQVEQGTVEVTFMSGDVAWVRGTVEGGPWLDIWRRDAGEWSLVAELHAQELAPIRFGARRHRGCSRTS